MVFHDSKIIADALDAASKNSERLAELTLVVELWNMKDNRSQS